MNGGELHAFAMSYLTELVSGVLRLESGPLGLPKSRTPPFGIAYS